MLHSWDEFCAMNAFAKTFAGISTGVIAASATAAPRLTGVKAYGFIDLEGAKVSAIIVEYDREIAADGVTPAAFEISDYAIRQARQFGGEAFESSAVPGREGGIVKVYVNAAPEPSPSGGAERGRFVVVEVETDYLLAGQNLDYRESMAVGVVQKAPLKCAEGTVVPAGGEAVNYTVVESTDRRGKTRRRQLADAGGILLPQFTPGSGWTIHRIGDGAFHARHCYSEYTGRYEDFELPYAIFVPSPDILEANRGKVALVLHMEHAGANSAEPLSSLASSRAAARHSGPEVQAANPAIVLVPQIEESRRATNDQMATSEANAAVWQLVDSVLDRYRGFIDENRIYGTGQSMGGMCILAMAAQRDNFFAGILAVGAQWGNNYDKAGQNGGDRTPDNDDASFNGFGLDPENYRNWYYMVSDDNILVQTCSGDPMATGLWRAAVDYFAAAGCEIPHGEWDPFLPADEQEETCAKLLARRIEGTPGGGIAWISFSRGSHMSTWKYGYRLGEPFRWLYSQRRDAEMRRGKLEGLKQPWLGRDADGKIREGSGTSGLNSAQFTPHGPDPVFTEGWRPTASSGFVRSVDVFRKAMRSGDHVL